MVRLKYLIVSIALAIGIYWSLFFSGLSNAALWLTTVLCAVVIFTASRGLIRVRHPQLFEGQAAVPPLLWLLRFEYFGLAAIVSTAAVWAISYAGDQRTIERDAVIPLSGLVIAGVMFITWIFYSKHFSNRQSLNTNRQAFRAVRILMALIPGFVKPVVAWMVTPYINATRGTDYGLGGSSSFSTMFDHWKQRFHQSRGDIFLGTSVWDTRTFVGQKDDMGGCTIAEPRSGKGTTFIIPNLKLYRGSVLVLDGKNGENLDATHKERSRYGNVLCVDPYKKSNFAQQHGRVRFNPLSIFNPNSPEILSELKEFTEALVPKTGEAKSDHFDGGGEDILRGLIAHLISTQQSPNLADVRTLLMTVMDQGPKGRALIAEMKANSACYGIVQDTAVMLEQDTTELKNFLSSAKKHTEWLTGPAMREALSASDFSFADLKAKSGTSLFLVLDGNTLKANASFLRLFLFLAIRAMRQGTKPRLPVLFMLDEFYMLGRLASIIDNIDDIPGYGVKLWPVFHRIGQMEELYGENWSGLLGGTQVYFCPKNETATYLSDELGNRGFERSTQVRDDRIYTPLLPASEIQSLTSNDPETGGHQIINRLNGAPMLLRRVPYFSESFRSVGVATGDNDPLEPDGKQIVYIEGQSEQQIEAQMTKFKPRK